MTKATAEKSDSSQEKQPDCYSFLTSDLGALLVVGGREDPRRNTFPRLSVLFKKYDTKPYSSGLEWKIPQLLIKNCSVLFKINVMSRAESLEWLMPTVVIHWCLTLFGTYRTAGRKTVLTQTWNLHPLWLWAHLPRTVCPVEHQVGLPLWKQTKMTYSRLGHFTWESSGGAGILSH